jgi:hypothetical protein
MSLVATKHVYVYLCRWIKNPHDKIALCICDQRNFFFWFNSTAAFHGEGQLAIKSGEHAAITKDCFLDLSGVKGISPQEIKTVANRGPISPALSKRIVTALSTPIPPLPDAHRQLAITNLK